jgi:hypothetical protein
VHGGKVFPQLRGVLARGVHFLLQLRDAYKLHVEALPDVGKLLVNGG